MEKFVISGGNRLKGEITPSGNKNEALPAIAAALLSEEPVILRNIPEIEDVKIMLELVRSAGASVDRIENGAYRISSGTHLRKELDRDLCRKIRASILFAGPLTAKNGELILPPPGGDVIGRRRIDTHFTAMNAMGIDHQFDGNFNLRISAGGIRGADIFLEEQSVTATENLMMLAALAKGTTRIENAACEPHVQGLAGMLQAMGARINGIGTNTLIVQGVERLRGADYTIGNDYLETWSYAGLAAIMGEGVLIRDSEALKMWKIRMVFEKLGVRIEEKPEGLFVAGNQQLRIKAEMFDAIPVIDDAPWPQFPTDLMSIAIVLAVNSAGTVVFFEKMYDGRMFFVDNLIAMGAKIILCDPHRVVVAGPSRLYGATLESPDIRAGMALIIASLSAEGTSTVYNIRQIDRGYEMIDGKLRGLGAEIQRVKI
ncbi:MAG: UDP-N-acetylglucosamine 1-carboxyvinyltransferase [Deltaproteobacteria bacterium]|nr:UDP-N-acetylglucosamine 1-carboxyvinyltransferase [Deltaproteobacteria bacterium]